MVPSYFVWMDSLPLSASGKVDKKASSRTGYLDDLHAGRDRFEPLLTATQKALARDMGRYTEASGDRGRTDNFFDIGGDSLLIVTVSAEVYKRFGVDVSLEKVYEDPTP